MNRRATPLAAALAAPALLAASAGCTFSNGSGFATLESATLTAELDGSPTALDTAAGVHVELRAAAIRVEHVLLAGELDAERPVESAGACHGDHCHSEDGDLVPDGEGDKAAPAEDALTAIAEFEVDAAIDLLTPRALSLGAAEPSKELPGGTILEVAVELTGLRIEGTATGSSLGPNPVPLLLDVTTHGDLHAAVSRELSRDEPAAIHLHVAIAVASDLLDGIDLEGLVADGAIEVTAGTAHAAPVTEAVAVALARSTLVAEL